MKRPLVVPLQIVEYSLDKLTIEKELILEVSKCTVDLVAPGMTGKKDNIFAERSEY